MRKRLLCRFYTKKLEFDVRIEDICAPTPDRHWVEVAPKNSGSIIKKPAGA